jgi:hypothetical protein
MKSCKDCGPGVNHEFWWDCPKLDRTHLNYGWKFAQGQNPSRREDFFKKAAADPFGMQS